MQLNLTKNASTKPRGKLLYTGFLVLSFFHVIVQLVVFLPEHLRFTDITRDHHVYYVALRQLHQGQEFYKSWPDYGPHLIPNAYFYPPPFLAALYPLGWLSEAAFSRLWYGIMLLSFWLYAWCLARLVSRRVSWDKILIAGLCLALCPGMMGGGMSMGNVQVVLTTLWGAAFAFNMRAVGLAVSAVIKIHPALPLGAALLDCARNQGWPVALRTIAVPALAVIIGAFILGLLICGPDAYTQWAREVPPVLSQGTFYHDNYSLSMGVLRLLRYWGIWHYNIGPLPSGPRFFLTTCTLAGPLLTWWVARRWPDDLRQACIGAATVLFAPLCWSCYFPILLVPLCIWCRELRSGNFRKFVILPSLTQTAP
jgi:hypothetical protein